MLTEVLGVVFAGGRSSRFGSDKFLHKFEGEEMGLRALRALSQTVDDLIVVGRHDVEPMWPGRGFCGPREGSGPLGALADVFEAHLNRYVLTLPCDMPHMSGLHCANLLRVITQSDVEVVVATDGSSTPQWLAAAWDSALVRSRLLAAYEDGERSVEHFIESCRTSSVVMDSLALTNLNELHTT